MGSSMQTLAANIFKRLQFIHTTVGGNKKMVSVTLNPNKNDE